MDCENDPMQINPSSFTTSAAPKINLSNPVFSAGNYNSLTGLPEIPTIRALDLSFSGFGGFAGGFTDLSNLVAYPVAPLYEISDLPAPKAKKGKAPKSALMKGSLAYEVASFYLGPNLDGKKPAKKSK